jgi:hypothetical protein
MAYVYQHIRLDTDEVFYIGIGSDTDGKYERANEIRRRNVVWRNILNKTKHRVEILIDGISWEEACKEEIRLIKHYGRKNLNEGPLVNLTNGGEGVVGVVWTEESKLKLSESLTGKKHSEEHKQNNSKCRMGELNTMFGKSHTEETKQKLRDRVITDEHRRKSAKANIGRKHSEEHIRKNREAQLGKIVSEETKRKISETQILRYKNKKLNTIPPKPHQFF